MDDMRDVSNKEELMKSIESPSLLFSSVDSSSPKNMKLEEDLSGPSSAVKDDSKSVANESPIPTQAQRTYEGT